VSSAEVYDAVAAEEGGDGGTAGNGWWRGHNWKKVCLVQCEMEHCHKDELWCGLYILWLIVWEIMSFGNLDFSTNSKIVNFIFNRLNLVYELVEITIELNHFTTKYDYVTIIMLPNFFLTLIKVN
jgi:hypothetical protein